ncbi:hypothetical protein ILUMI_18968 [Ignelater luminosus]|uniref:Uncharacterized protein n=1 Tax=Ignelater luminosus TaxID=2038154 RepID=A0A8K0G0D3_IGNLU|nr:hypothetical protein ILUMI_18968 [Ignelater luminosus]
MDELMTFSHNFEGLRQSPSVSTTNNLLKDSCDEDYYLEDSDVDSEDEDLDLDRQIVHKDGSCVGCFRILELYNLHTTAYSNLYVAYKAICQRAPFRRVPGGPSYP